MADDEVTEETGEATPAASDVERRVDGLEEKVDRILGILGGSSSKPDSSSEPAPQQPGNIADEIRQQLDERDRKANAAAEDAAKTDRLAALETKVSELAEKPPETMPRRVEKFMGWR